MKAGTRVKTPDGKGVVIKPIGKTHPPGQPILVKLDKMIGMYSNFFYAVDELTVL